MHVISYRGIDFAANHFWAGLRDDQARGQWGIVPQIMPRRNDAGEITGVVFSERPLSVEFGILSTNPAATNEAAFFTLLGLLNPMDATPGELVIELEDETTQLACQAIITAPGGISIDGSVDTIVITFLTTDPLWRALTPVTEGPASVDNLVYGGLTVDVDGEAPVHGTVRLTPTATHQSVMVSSFTVTNNGSRTMVNFPVRVDFGDTWPSPWSVPPAQFILIKEGVRQRCQMIAPGTNQTYLWIVVDYLPAGESIDYMLLSSGSYIMPGTTFNSYTQPVFDTTGEQTNTTAGGTSTVHQFSTATWEVNQWRGGVLRALTGAHAGLERTISSSTATSVTTSAFPTALATGDAVLLTMSSNGKWVYPVRQTERSDSRRGLWWIDQGQKKPGDFRHDVPGAWKPYLYYDNNDEKVQKNWTPVNVGTVDYFAILDTNRTWEGATTFKEEGGADGVSITMPFPITGLRFTHQLKNPNGMATFVVGSRESGGAADFVHEYTNTAQLDTLTNQSEQNLSFTSEIIQLYLGLIPTTVSSVVADEIGGQWGRDSGTATSGNVSQLNDNTKAWVSDQWIGGRVRIVSGTGAGQDVAITDSSPNTISATFTTAPDNTSRYELRQKALIATVRTHDRFELTWDASDLTVSTPTVAVPGYILDRNLFLNRATASADPPYQQLLFDADSTSRYIAMVADETLVIDGAAMRAWIEDASGNELRAVPPRAIRVQDVEADGTTRLAEKWLLLAPGPRTLMLAAKADGNDYDMELDYTPAYIG